MEELDVFIRTVFEEKVLKKMPESLCNSLCESYRKEQQLQQTEIVTLQKKLQEESKDEADVEEYIIRIKLYGNCPELAREMCLQLIKCKDGAQQLPARSRYAKYPHLLQIDRKGTRKS